MSNSSTSIFSLSLPYPDTKSSFEENLQANILKGHGRDHLALLFISIKRPEVAKRALKVLASKITSAKLLNEQKLNYKKQIEKTGVGNFTDTTTVINVSISKTGFDKLGYSVPEEKAPDIIEEILLNDNGRFFEQNTKDQAKEFNDDIEKNWEDWAKTQEIDLLFHIASDNLELIHQKVAEYKLLIKSFGELIHTQFGHGLKRKISATKTMNLEHFGYADGISDPVFLNEDVKKDTTGWSDHAGIETILIKDPNTEEEEAYGSFFVFRKLKQDVKGFNEQLKEFSQKFKNAKGEINPKLPEAIIMGRFKNGTPLINSFGKEKNERFDEENNFTYVNDPINRSSDVKVDVSNKCPFNSHARLTNPRRDIDEVFARGFRISRRGIPYQDSERFTLGQMKDLSEKDMDNYDHTENVGLLFMSYQASIEKQFGFIQRVWSNGGTVNTLYNNQARPVGKDPVIGQTDKNASIHFPTQWGDSGSEKCPVEMKEYIKCVGASYFFTPSISFFKHIK